MKKLITLLLCLCLCFSLFAELKTSYFNLGVGLSASGRSDAVTVWTLETTYIPFDFDYCNPSLRAWTGASWDGKTTVNYEGAGLGVSLELGRFKFNPLQFTTNNVSRWTPSVTAGVLYSKLNQEDKYSLKFYAEASIFRVSDKDFIYEWFSPFMIMNENTKLWGVTIFRLTPLYHVGKEVKI